MSYFSLVIPSTYSSKEDLVIKASATEKNPFENPDIFLSLENTEPTKETSILSCSS